MAVRGVNQLPGVRKSHVEIEGDSTEAPDQLGKYHEMLLYVRVHRRANRIKNTDQIGFLIGKAKVAITKVQCFGEWNDRGQLSTFLPVRLEKR